jgi:hypothetical protein
MRILGFLFLSIEQQSINAINYLNHQIDKIDTGQQQALTNQSH